MPLARRALDLLRPPAEADPLSALRSRDPERRCRAARALGVGAPSGAARQALRVALRDPVPGVRRAAAWALGRVGDLGDPPELLRLARLEARDEPRLAMAVAAARLGGALAEPWSILERAAARILETATGPRAVAALSGAGRSELARRWAQILDPDALGGDPAGLRPVPPDALRERLWARLRGDPGDPRALQDLGAQEDPRDLEPMTALARGAGRRGALIHLGATGQGDPRVLDALVAALRAVDVDPGAGFASRAVAARALGRLGLPRAVPALLRALEDEALDHEGRPGAGLGVQLPVRAVILAALGECGDARVAETLASYLSDLSGTPLGGFYLPAMDALIKIGEPAPLRRLLGGPEIAATNAAGVLSALERRPRR